MRKAYYMNFQESEKDNLDKVGGLPTHLPENFPTSSTTGKFLGFLLQLYCDDFRLYFPDALCLQIYQSMEIDFGDDPTPIIVKVPKNAPRNNQNLGTIHYEIKEYGIFYEVGEEPDILPTEIENNPQSLKLLSSKLGGAIPIEYNDNPEKKYLGWIADYPVDFNFAGLLVLLSDSKGNIFCEIL